MESNMSSHRLFNKVDLSILPKQSYIIEIGSIRQPEQLDNADSSTHYFDDLAKENNMNFQSVDFSKASYELSKAVVGDRAFCMDGVSFIRNFSGQIGILYLDNFDIVYSEKHRLSLMSRVGTSYEENNETITNERSAEVHLEQMKEALPKMTKPCFVCVDDTMIRDGDWWGKGATVVPFLLEQGFNIIKQNDAGVLLGYE